MKQETYQSVVYETGMKGRPLRYFFVALVLALGVVVAYAWIYFFEPFSERANDWATNLLAVLPAIASAGAIALVWSFYTPGEPHRKVWRDCLAGLGLWVVADICWMALNLTYGEVDVGLPDVFWILAYIPLTAAILSQYALVHPYSPQAAQGVTLFQRIWYRLLIILAVLALINIFAVSSFITSLLNYFYPVGDLLIVLAAIWVARLFWGGAFAWPWLGFLWFAAADLLYAWLEASGLYAWSVTNGTLLSGLADILYTTSYLAITLGAFAQWLTMRYSFLSVRRLEE